MRTLSEKKLALAPTRFCGIRCREYDATAEVPIRTATAADRDGILALAHADEMVKVTNGLIQSGPGQFCAASAAFFDGMIEKGCVYIADGPAGGAIGAVAILPPSPWADAEKGLSFVAGTDDAAIVSLLTGCAASGQARRPELGRIDPRANLWLPFDAACQLVAEGKVDGWARHSKTPRTCTAGRLARSPRRPSESSASGESPGRGVCPALSCVSPATVWRYENTQIPTHLKTYNRNSHARSPNSSIWRYVSANGFSFFRSFSSSQSITASASWRWRGGKTIFDLMSSLNHGEAIRHTSGK